MSRPIAVVDSDVIVIALDTTGAAAVQQRQEYITLTLERLDQSNPIWVIPTIVVAELQVRRDARAAVNTVATTLVGQLRIQALEEAAAVVAGDVIQRTIATRPAGASRATVKFDALIFGMAHQMNARWLVTGNRGDYVRYKDALASPVEIVDATAQPNQGQQVLPGVLRMPPPNP